MLTDIQRRKLSRYFRVYDIDDDGRIGLPDFRRVLENVRILHGHPTDSRQHQELEEVFQRRWEALRDSADLDDDEGVDLEEWLAYWDGVLADEERYEREVSALVGRLVETFDTDEDGVLGADEFCDFYGIYGLASALARQVFLDLDLDGDGAVSRDELVEMAHQFYRSEDPDAPGNRLFGPY